VNKELFFDMIMQQLPAKLTPNGMVFLSTTPKQTILDSMKEILHTGKGAAQIFNKLRGTIHESATLTDIDLNSLFNSQDYSGRDLSGIDLNGLSVYSTDFTGANLSSANFADSIVVMCNFTNANLKFSNFTVSKFDDNTVDSCDFDGASIAKDIDWDKQHGTAKNVTVSNVTYDKKKLSRVLESRPSNSYSIPIRDEQLGEANSLAKALKGILEKLHIFLWNKKV
jgi:hypothetical protein